MKTPNPSHDIANLEINKILEELEKLLKSFEGYGYSREDNIKALENWDFDEFGDKEDVFKYHELKNKLSGIKLAQEKEIKFLDRINFNELLEGKKDAGILDNIQAKLIRERLQALKISNKDIEEKIK